MCQLVIRLSNSAVSVVLDSFPFILVALNVIYLEFFPEGVELKQGLFRV